MNKVNFSKKYLVIAISSLIISQNTVASQQNNYDATNNFPQQNMENNSNLSSQEIQNVEGNQQFVDDNNSQGEMNESFINPFTSTQGSIEDITMKNRLAEKKLELMNTELELERRKFEKEILPYQQEIQKQELSRQAYENNISNRNQNMQNQQNQSQPQLTDQEIQRRIERVASNEINKREQRINELESQIEKEEQKRNTFNLKMIAEGNGGTFAIISNDEQDFTVEQGDEAEGWRVINIDKENQGVILSKKGNTIVVKPESDNSISKIMTQRFTNSSGESNSNTTGMPNPDIPVPSNLPN